MICVANVSAQILRDMIWEHLNRTQITVSLAKLGSLAKKFCTCTWLKLQCQKYKRLHALQYLIFSSVLVSEIAWKVTTRCARDSYYLCWHRNISRAKLPESRILQSQQCHWIDQKPWKLVSCIFAKYPVSSASTPPAFVQDAAWIA